MTNKLSIWVSVGTAVLAFIGALTGTFISGSMQEHLWERQSSYEERGLILNQRVSLIERMSIMINKGPIMEALQDYATLQADLAKLNVGCIKSDGKGGLDQRECFPHDPPLESTKFINGRAELNAEFASTMQLASIYFGPKTKEAIVQYIATPEWWKAESKLSKAVLSAMHEELAYFE